MDHHHHGTDLSSIDHALLAEGMKKCPHLQFMLSNNSASHSSSTTTAPQHEVNTTHTAESTIQCPHLQMINNNHGTSASSENRSVDQLDASKCPHLQKLGGKTADVELTGSTNGAVARCPLGFDVADHTTAINAQNEFICPVCNSYFQDCVVIAGEDARKCNHAFCRYCLTKRIEEQKKLNPTQLLCTICFTPFRESDVKSDSFRQYKVNSYIEAQWFYQYQYQQQQQQKRQQYDDDDDNSQEEAETAKSKATHYLRLGLDSLNGNPAAALARVDKAQAILLQYWSNKVLAKQQHQQGDGSNAAATAVSTTTSTMTTADVEIGKLLGVITGKKADISMILGKTEDALQLYEDSIRYLNQLPQSNEEVSRDLGIAYGKWGDAYYTSGNMTRTKECYQAYYDLAKRAFASQLDNDDDDDNNNNSKASFRQSVQYLVSLVKLVDITRQTSADGNDADEKLKQLTAELAQLLTVLQERFQDDDNNDNSRAQAMTIAWYREFVMRNNLLLL